ncbi:MAG: HD domain-containing protein [Dehalococcoidia bacterium]
MANLAGAVAHRVGQVLRGLRTTIPGDDAAAVRALLSTAELTLFLGMHPRDRVHAICVMRLLEGEGAASHHLLAAGLLHDVAKGQPRLWDRTLFAIVESLSLRAVDRLAARDGMRWRRAMWALRHHPSAGAALLREAGSSERVVELVAHHIERGGTLASSDSELASLIAADGAC